MSILKPIPAVSSIQHRALPSVAPVTHKPVPATLSVVHPATSAVAPSGTLREQALSVTREIQKNLEILKKAFLRVVFLLGRVRDETLYAELGYTTIEAYAASQLGLKRSSLYAYLRVFDWIRQNHPAWLKPGAKVKIADLNDATDLIWIENELERESLPEPNKEALQDLKKKALAGTLRRNELRAYKSHGNNMSEGVRAFLSKMRHLRETGAKLAGLPEGVLTHLESAIDILKSSVVANKAQAERQAEKRKPAGK